MSHRVRLIGQTKCDNMMWDFHYKNNNRYLPMNMDYTILALSLFIPTVYGFTLLLSLALDPET